MKRFKKKKNEVDVEGLKISTKNKEIAIKLVELEKKAQEDSNFDYVTAMEKLLVENNVSIGDMIDIDFYIQSQSEKLFEIKFFDK